MQYVPQSCRKETSINNTATISINYTTKLILPTRCIYMFCMDLRLNSTCFPMWRRILRVPWIEKRTNLSVLEDVKPKRSLEATILWLKLRYFGHVMRAKKSLEWDIILWHVEGHRKQGKPRMRWLDSIKEATGLRLEDLREAVQDRKKWRTRVEEKTQNRERTNLK